MLVMMYMTNALSDQALWKCPILARPRQFLGQILATAPHYTGPSARACAGIFDAEVGPRMRYAFTREGPYGVGCASGFDRNGTSCRR